MRFPFRRVHYFKGHVSKGFRSLYIGKSILAVATGLLGLFLPIFLYQLFGESVIKTFIYYGIASLLYLFTVSLGGMLVSKLSFRKSIQMSVIFGALFYAIFFFISDSNIQYLIGLSIIILTLFRVTYWLPFHTDFAKFTTKENRAKEVGALMAIGDIVGVVIPVTAGFIISKFGFDVVFLMGVFVFLISGIPYFMLPKTKEKFTWNYWQTWKEFFAKRNRKKVVAFFADGIETTAALIVWPIFIFQILQGDYLQVGLVSTFIIGTTVTLDLAVGAYLDKTSKESSVLKVGTAMYALGWILKIFVATAFHIFIVGAYHSIIKIFTREPFDTLFYEIAADEGHYVDEFTVLHEMAIHAGRVIGISIFIALAFYFSIQWIFIIAAISVLFFNVLRRSKTGQHLSQS